MFSLILLLTTINALEITPIDPIVQINSTITLICCHDKKIKGFTFYPNFTEIDSLCGIKTVTVEKTEKFDCHYNGATYTTVYAVSESNFDIAIENTNYTFNCHDGKSNEHFHYWWNRESYTNQLTIVPIMTDAYQNFTCSFITKTAAGYYDISTAIQKVGFLSIKQLSVMSLVVENKTYILTIASSKKIIVKWFLTQELNSYTTYNNTIQSICSTDGLPMIHVEYNGNVKRFNVTEFVVIQVFSPVQITAGIIIIVLMVLICSFIFIIKRKKKRHPYYALNVIYKVKK
jgi:hypothetical protein